MFKELKSTEAQNVVKANVKVITDAEIKFMIGNFGSSRLDIDFLLSVPISIVSISENVPNNAVSDSCKNVK